MRSLVPLAASLLAGCATAAPPPRPDPGLARVVAMAADQVRRCYRAPRIGRGGGGIVTVLDVAYAPDGTLATLPALAKQLGVTAGNAQAAEALAEAAALAVTRCVPLRLPAAQYRGGWDSFQLTFSPKAMA